jgi:hypothetical protein
VIKWTVVIIEKYYCYGLHTKFYQAFFSQSSLEMKKKLCGIIFVNFDIIDELLIRYYACVRYQRKIGSAMGEYTNYLRISRKPVIHLRGKYFTTFSFNSIHE